MRAVPRQDLPGLHRVVERLERARAGGTPHRTRAHLGVADAHSCREYLVRAVDQPVAAIRGEMRTDHGRLVAHVRHQGLVAADQDEPPVAELDRPGADIRLSG